MLDIQLLGINAAGMESGNDVMTAGRNLPWLQDVVPLEPGEESPWTSWDVTLRDVVILDADNHAIDTFNLTTYDLHDPDNYNTLRQILIDAAKVPEPATLSMLVFGGFMFLRRRR